MAGNGAVDLSNCDQEQIQFSGAVQPYAALVALHERTWHIQAISANCLDLFGRPAESILNKPLTNLIGEQHSERVRREVARQQTLACPPAFLLTARLPPCPHDLHIFAHRNDDGLLILEFEGIAHDGAVPLQELYSEIRSSLAELQQTPSVQAFFDVAVARIRQFTGYDRVLAYKFLEDGSGRVMAEDRVPDLESYVGLHYPASDIPEPARRLFSLKWVSHLPDVDYIPIPLMSSETTGDKPIDLSRAFSRSVSVMYTGYLRNMGVRSTMVLTLLRNGKLWGLISCMHHREPKYVSYPARIAAEFLAHVLSLAMAQKEQLEERDYVNTMQSLQIKLVESMAREENFWEGLIAPESNVLSYFGATAAVIALGEQFYTLGNCPTNDQLQALVAWLGANQTREQQAWDRLSAIYSPASAYAEMAAGLLSLRLFAHKSQFILWFLPEVEQTVNWAGDPRKPVEVSQTNGLEHLSPRKSFALWRESVKGASRPWRDSELAAVSDLRRAIVEVVLRKAETLTKTNEELARANLELDAFAYIASHDLKEPLRGIHNYARFVLEDYADRLGADGKDKLTTMVRLTDRMDALIEGLLHYSRLGREEMQFESTDLNDLVGRVVQSLTPRLEELRVTVNVRNLLPTLPVNPILMQEVFANLITNAMKYNDNDHKWIEIGKVMHVEPLSRVEQELSKGREVVYVKDNGIGIPAQYHNTIFHIFRRLHGRDQYGGGTGVGLTIAKKILERHDGEMWVESEPGQGSIFSIALPVQRDLNA